MAKFITFNGITLVHPGGLTKVDTTGMAQVGQGVSGVVGIIGEADYGEPYNPVTAKDAGVAPKVYAFTDPDSMASTFKSGALADAVDFVFNPSNDIRIPGGAQTVIAIKSNRDTQSSVAAEDISTANVACTFTSAIYGQHANALSATLDVNALNNSTLDLSITDGNTATTETFTQICGTPLLDVQYAPSTPTQVGAEATTNALSAFATLEVVAASIAEPGQYVQITEATAGQEFLAGQVRRVLTNVGTTIAVSGEWADAAGTVGATQPAVGTKFIVIREAVGPFDVVTYSVADMVIAATAVPGAAPTGPSFFVAAGATGDDYYGDPTNGPCYVHIVSGAGAGQIRRIATAAEAAALTLAQGLVSGTPPLGYSIQLTAGFDVAPNATSKFVFINAVPKNTAGTPDAPTSSGSAATGEGAVGVIGGTVSTTGKATSLTLSARPGYGEDTGAAAWVAAGAAGALRTGGDWEFTLSDGLNINALVTAINLSNTIAGATRNAATATGAWKARVGLGRDGSLPSDRFDWTDRSNGAVGASSGVDCLCDFATTNPLADGDYSTTPNRYHRFVDNLALLIDTINSQSSLITAARATAAGSLGTAYGDGVPAFQTYPLSGGDYVPTTASGLADCFDELIKHRFNTAVALWSTDHYDEAGALEFQIDYVHSLLATMANNGAGAYNNEVDCIAAFQPATADPTPVDTIKTQANTLNNRNVALTFQDITRPGLNGSVNTYPPHMLACAVAGMQSGSTVGTPLTYKLVRANDILCANTLVDTLDKTTSDDLLLNGCLFTEKVKGQGFRITRNLSTYVATDNLAYTDRHVNYELNFMAYDLRTFIVDKFVGVKATPGTVASVKSAVISKLDYYKNGIEIIVDSQDLVTGERLNAYRDLNITISGDICTIRFEVFPAVGINYITFEIFAKLPTLSA